MSAATKQRKSNQSRKCNFNRMVGISVVSFVTRARTLLQRRRRYAGSWFFLSGCIVKLCVTAALWHCKLSVSSERVIIWSHHRSWVCCEVYRYCYLLVSFCELWLSRAHNLSKLKIPLNIYATRNYWVNVFYWNHNQRAWISENCLLSQRVWGLYERMFVEVSCIARHGCQIFMGRFAWFKSVDPIKYDGYPRKPFTADYRSPLTRPVDFSRISKHTHTHNRRPYEPKINQFHFNLLT